MTPPSPLADNEPLAYLTAATAGIRHHARTTTSPPGGRPATRGHVDALHAHLTALHTLLGRLTQQTRDERPAQSSHFAAARTRLWQAGEHLHDAFHQAPRTPASGPDAPQDDTCEQDIDPTGPPFLTICLRHLRTSTVVRQETTPADLHSPLHGHARHRAG
ncbi:DUF6238 family protein [Streptomyces roseifaciens]|uniref:DUF6238 family protein n=1 Tax=Streptomyces roseifaciens TaxID=1488406 RepID=UPI000717DF99|nr:DUF6238 family protein [Streptomyces roseifaciens]